MYAEARAGAGPALQDSDNTPTSALTVVGTLATHSLFNFLHAAGLAHAWAGAGDAGRDVPLLLAAAPFEHASLQPLRLRTGQRVRLLGAADPSSDAPPESRPGGAATSGRREAVYTATVRAAVDGIPLGPWNVSRLLEVLRSSQEGAFDARMDTHALATAFNLRLPMEPAAAGPQLSDAGQPAPPPPGSEWEAEGREMRGAGLGWEDDVCAALRCRDGLFSRMPDKQ